MSICPDGTDQYKAASSPLGNATNYTAETQTVGGIDPKAFISDKVERAARSVLVDDISNAPAASGPTGEKPTPGEARNIRATSKFISGLIDKASDAYQKRLDRMGDMLTLVNGTTVGEVNGWLHKVFTIDRYLRNQRAPINEYLYSVAQDKNAPHWQQRLAQINDEAPNLIRAQQNIFYNKLNEFIEKSVIPIARREGHNVKELLKMIGDYAIMLHIPEANAELLRAWRSDSARIEQMLRDHLQKKGTRANSEVVREYNKEMLELETRIFNLENNLESIDKPQGLYSAGYTNRQARDLAEAILQKTRMSREEADALAGQVTELFNFVLSRRAEKGLVAKEQLEAFPRDFQHYVALLSRNENAQGATNDARPYDPGYYHQRRGMKETPDDAISTLTYYMNRAATEIGMQELGSALYMLKVSRGDKAATQLGLKSESYNTLMRWKSGKAGYENQAKAIEMLNNGGLVVDAPVTDKKTGKTELSRHYLWLVPYFVVG